MAVEIVNANFAIKRGPGAWEVDCVLSFDGGTPEHQKYGVNRTDKAPVCVELLRRIDEGEIPQVPAPEAEE